MTNQRDQIKTALSDAEPDWEAIARGKVEGGK